MTTSNLWLAAAAAAALGFASHASAQTAASRDLNGIWTNASLTPLARAKGVDKLEVSAEEAAKIVARTGVAGLSPEESRKTGYSDPKAGAPAKGGSDFGVRGYDTGWVAPGEKLAMVGGRYRTSNIVEPSNGQLPYRDMAAAARTAQLRGIKYATGNDPYEGPESTAISERCLIGFGGTGGPGMLSVLYNNNYQFVLTKDNLAIVVEMVHDTRIIPIFPSAQKARASHGPAAIKRWLGDGVGWWEGDTLVVESINVHPLEAQNGPFALSSKAKITERFTRTGPKEIAYTFTVDDPETYTQPWKAELSFYPQSNLYEYACHEGNYGMVGILQGARNKEKAALANDTPAASAKTGG